MESINLTDYVPFDIAQNLHAKGFDVVTEKSYFVGDGEKRYVKVGTLVNSPSNAPHLIAAPTVQMANKFLRERYNIFIQVELYSKNGDFTYEIFKNTKRMDIKRKVFPTPEEANLDALLVCLTNLI